MELFFIELEQSKLLLFWVHVSISMDTISTAEETLEEL